MPACFHANFAAHITSELVLFPFDDRFCRDCTKLLTLVTWSLPQRRRWSADDTIREGGGADASTGGESDDDSVAI